MPQRRDLVETFVFEQDDIAAEIGVGASRMASGALRRSPSLRRKSIVDTGPRARLRASSHFMKLLSPSVWPLASGVVRNRRL